MSWASDNCGHIFGWLISFNALYCLWYVKQWTRHDSPPIPVVFSASEINDLRASVQSEFSEYLGYPVELEDATTTDGTGHDVAFRILGAVYLSDVDDQKYREVFWKHQRRIVEAQIRPVLHSVYDSLPWGFPFL